MSSALFAIARMANTNRSLSNDLLVAQSSSLKDATMFAKLEAYAAELETEADGFIKDHLTGVARVEQRFANVISKIKGARADMAKTATDAGTLGQDVEKDVADVLTLRTTTVAALGALEIDVTGSSTPTIGAVLSNVGIAANTVVTSIDAAAGKLGLSLPTIAEIEAGATIVVTPAS